MSSGDFFICICFATFGVFIDIEKKKKTYEYLKQDKSTWYCIVCTKEFFPFSKLNDENLKLTLKGAKIKFVNVAQKRIL